jgi:hypothetical protein
MKRQSDSVALIPTAVKTAAARIRLAEPTIAAEQSAGRRDTGATAAAPPANDVEQVLRRLVRTVPILADARPRLGANGTEARLELDPAIVSARADQQGLGDQSERAAAQSPRVQSMLRAEVAALNAALEASQRVVRCRIHTRSGVPVAEFATL